MWARDYWGPSYFSTRYWTKTGLNIGAGACGCSPYGDGSKYGNMELYCNSTFVRRAYLVVKDVLYHNLACRITFAGGFILSSLTALTMVRKTLPFQYQVDCHQSRFRRLSVRFTAQGCMKIQRINAIVKERKGLPYV